jgi:hypothetical protein
MVIAIRLTCRSKKSISSFNNQMPGFTMFKAAEVIRCTVEATPKFG